MDYLSEIILPPNTLEANAIENILTLPKGVVGKVSVLFPPGCYGLAHVKVLSGMTCLWPSTPDTSYCGDDTLIDFPEDYILANAWNQLKILGWNDDETYQHTVVVRFSVVSDKIPPWAKLVFGSLFKKK